MSDIYVYSAHCDDFTNFGLVGALTPTSCIFEEVANGMSEITLEHPIDPLGRYTQLATNNILMVEVPVRTTPEINGNTIVTSVEKWTVKNPASKALRTIYKKREAKKDVKIKVLPEGASVTVVSNNTDYARVKVKCKYGTGWIDREGLENKVILEPFHNNSQAIESVEPAWTVKPQLFRIYSVEKTLAGVCVMARHISYDLLYNLTTFVNTKSTTCAAALAGIMNKCVSDHDFEAYTNLVTARTGVNWTRTNPIDAILNPDNGLTTRYGASLVRDNWELYVLHDPGLNRGVTIEYGKNMTGITYTESFDSTVTRIIPVGETKSGKPLLLPEVYVDDPNTIDDVYGNKIKIMDTYPVIYTQELICEDCKVGDDTDDKTDTYNKMRDQANALFAAGCDLPTVEMSVEFVNLGDTAEYAQFKDLERLFLWDYVTVRHKLHGINVTARIASIRWNCLLDRMEGMDIGSVGKTLANSGITSWQIPTGISGSKIASGTIGGIALGDGAVSGTHIQNDSIVGGHIQEGGIIGAYHIQAESINAGQIAAQAITADRIASHTITADQIKAGAIDADAIKAVTAEIQKIATEELTTDELYAAMAKITVLSAGTGSFDLATVKNLLSNALILQEGVADSMMITNLAVTSANLLSATIGELVLKGDDGKYYRVYVGADGTVYTEEVTVSGEEIAAGQTSTGHQIVETNANIKNLNAQNIKAASAIIDTIVTNALTAGKITATDALIASATIPTLYTTAIKAIGDTLDLSANESITLIVGKQSKTYRQEDEPKEANFGDLWVVPSTGQTFQCSAVASDNVALPTFALDSNGNLVYTSGEGQEDLEMYINDEGELVYDGIPYAFEIDKDGNLKAVSEITWDLVQDDAISKNVEDLNKNSLTKKEFNDYYMRIDADNGVEIGRSEAESKLVLTNESVNVKVNGETFSTFTGDYVQFGNYQIRKSAKGALVFKLAQ